MRPGGRVDGNVWVEGWPTWLAQQPLGFLQTKRREGMSFGSCEQAGWQGGTPMDAARRALTLIMRLGSWACCAARLAILDQPLNCTQPSKKSPSSSRAN
jgi:hypothetical protein